MKILYLAFAELDIPNACRIHVVEVIRNFATLGHRVVAILPRPLTAVLFPEGVITSYVYPWNFSWYGKFLFNVLAGLRMLGHLLWYRPDIVYIREMGSNPLTAWLCRVFRVPLFVEINGWLMDLFSRAGASRLRLTIEHRLQAYELQSATGVILSSDRRRTRLLDGYSLSPDDCAFFINGFTADVFSPGDRLAARSKLQLEEDAFGLVFVGCLWDAYDLSMYFRLLGRLHTEFPQLVIWIIGDGPLRREWELQAQTFGVSQQVRFVGYQSEEVAADWIRAGNLCLAPHSPAGLDEHGAITSTKLWAYAACGRALLVHHDLAHPFPSEFIHLFRLVSPMDEEGIESAIRTALADPDSLDHEGSANAAWVSQNATWAHTVQRTIHFIQERIP